MIRLPIVRMIRQPPLNVPRAIAVADGEDHPHRHVEVRGRDRPVGDQRERDQPHRLLRVVGAVGEREQPARGELAEPEAAVDRPGPQPPDDPVDEQDRQPGDRERDERRDDRRDDQLVEQPVAGDLVRARRRPTPSRPGRRSARARSSTAARSTR